MWHASNEKRQTTPDERNWSTKSRQKLDLSDKGKPTNSKESWKLIPSKKRRRKEKLRKHISEESESYTRQNYIAGTLSEE